MGSVSESVIGHAHCPVLVVREEPPGLFLPLFLNVVEWAFSEVRPFTQS
jgi:hypothetical protein